MSKDVGISMPSGPLATSEQQVAPSSPERNKVIFTVGSVMGAIAASSCCVLPLVLFFLGASGAWIGNLAALTPYQPIFILITVICLAGGFYSVYRKPKEACAAGSYCSTPVSNRVVRISLWSATVLVALAAVYTYIAPSILGI